MTADTYHPKSRSVEFRDKRHLRSRVSSEGVAVGFFRILVSEHGPLLDNCSNRVDWLIVGAAAIVASQGIVKYTWFSH